MRAEREALSEDVIRIDQRGGSVQRTGRWVVLDNQAPYSWNVPAPVVKGIGDCVRRFIGCVPRCGDCNALA